MTSNIDAESGGLRILIVVDRDRAGGLQRAEVEWGDLHRSAGHEVHYAVLGEETGALASVGARPVTALPRRSLWRTVRNLRAFLRLEGIDVVRSTQAYPTVVAEIARSRLATAHVAAVFNHPGHVLRRRPSRLGPLRHHLTMWAYRSADVLVGVSEGVSRDLRARTGHRVVRTVYCSVIPEDYAAAVVPREHDHGEGRPLVVAVGKMTRQKDPDTLLGAIAALRRRREVSLVYLGVGPEDSQAVSLARRYGVEDVVEFVGVQDPRPWFAAADVVVSSSRFEGLCRALVEAAACGARIVPTDAPFGPAEVASCVEGFVVPVGDPDALAAGIEQALDAGPPTNVDLGRFRPDRVGEALERATRAAVDVRR